MAKHLKVGVHQGDGPEPGYQWNVVIFDKAHRESVDVLNEDQHHHMAEQVKELAREEDPTHSETASVDAVEDFHELRDKGGILGGLNVRVFFCLDKPRRSIVVLGTFVKKNDGATPPPVKIRIKRRKRLYFQGQLGTAELRLAAEGEAGRGAEDGGDR